MRSIDLDIFRLRRALIDIDFCLLAFYAASSRYASACCHAILRAAVLRLMLHAAYAPRSADAAMMATFLDYFSSYAE